LKKTSFTKDHIFTAFFVMIIYIATFTHTHTKQTINMSSDFDAAHLDRKGISTLMWIGFSAIATILGFTMFVGPKLFEQKSQDGTCPTGTKCCAACGWDFKKILIAFAVISTVVIGAILFFVNYRSKTSVDKVALAGLSRGGSSGVSNPGVANLAATAGGMSPAQLQQLLASVTGGR
jgi:hypothetical protein